MAERRPHLWRLRLAALATGLLAAYALLELAGGILLLAEQTTLANPALREQTEAHGRRIADRNGWHLAPDCVLKDGEGIAYRINNLGFRGPDADLAGLREDTRVVIGIGDSCMYGAGVPEQGTFTAQLQRALGDSTPVLNTGISSTGYEEYGRQLQYVYDDLGLRPRAVVVMLCANDIGWFPYTYIEMAYPKRGLLNILPVRPVAWWRGWSLWYRGFVQTRIDPLRLPLLSYTAAGEMPPRLRAMRVAQTYRMLDAVRQMDERCRAAGTKLLTFVLPSGYQYEPAALHDNLLDAERFGQEMRLVLRVPLLTQERQGIMQERKWMLDSVHPSAEFHGAMARDAARWLQGDEP